MGPILIVLENGAAGVTEATKECVNKAKSLAAQLGTTTVAVGFGKQHVSDLRRLAVTKVVIASGGTMDLYNPDAYEKVLAEIFGNVKPYLTLIANTTMGLDLGAGLAGRTQTPLIAYGIDIEEQDGRLTAISQVFAGKLLARVPIPEDGAIVTVIPGSWPADNEAGDPEIEEWTAQDSEAMRVLRVVEPEQSDIDITKADILVSVGRGIEGPDNLPLAEDLAEALGGVVSCSRPVVDAGWLPKARQVGKSGQTVKPKLYLACGISGAPEHLQGMRDADLIIAINTDESASIMDIAHFGTTADMLELMPALAERLKGG
ncbi:electron transfer flavoprotein subunit alpha [Sulfobacillus thermotolerans]|uniref:Electron transfer flavoprotein subunit alpha n=1 Tax=Sulfobacillus thermotolerans TaxID=338644 RepID=A0ABM6RQQ5_9FIRM|nr:electron transfer flavoprotein subunit alpha [Sulfobacillus thermotolerans]